MMVWKPQLEVSAAADDLSEKAAWRKNSGRLADWAMARLVNRKDAYGSYFQNGGAYRSCKRDGRVDRDLLRRHFAGKAIIGFYTTSTDDTCRWLTIDIDRHDGDPDEVVPKNDEFARHLYNNLVSLGFRPLLSDSNGKGGRHLTVIFDRPVPAKSVRQFGQWLVRQWKGFGLVTKPEVFPKQDTISKSDGTTGYGNYVRLVGRHYKRPHFSKVWDGSTWLSGEEAIAAILGHDGQPFDLVPPEATTYELPRKVKPQDWSKYRGDLRTLDLQGLFESRGLWVRDDGPGKLKVQCPWADEHTTGGDSAGVLLSDADRGLFPTFHCFHSHCEGRKIDDVLDFFGRRDVDKFCGRSFGGRPKPVIIRVDPTDPMAVAEAYQRARGDHLVHHQGLWRRWNGRVYVTISDADLRAALWKWMSTTSDGKKPTSAAVNSALDALRAVANVPTTHIMPCWVGEGSSRPHPDEVVAFANGLLDLDQFTRDGRADLLPHTPGWFSANCLDHRYDPNAQCEDWLKFLDQVFEGDPERIRALAMWFGYNLTSDIRQHTFAVFCGPPRSGKGTVTRVLTALLGSYNVATPTLSSLGGRFGLASLPDKLAAIIGDGHLGRHADAVATLERLKSITGGDPQNIDRKNAAELANVVIQARFTIAVNEMPRLPDASAALRSRMLVIPFNVSFEGKEDRTLVDRLLEEIPGIMNWALAGLLDLRREGRLVRPKAGRAILDDFARLSSPVHAFVEDCCEIGPEFWVETAELQRAWRAWCEEHGHEHGSDAAFGGRLRAVNPRIERRRRRVQRTQIYVYEGLRLTV
jgi:putative DNA primase/helicase